MRAEENAAREITSHPTSGEWALSEGEIAAIITEAFHEERKAAANLVALMALSMNATDAGKPIDRGRIADAMEAYNDLMRGEQTDTTD